jgi:hypothetical protein
MPQVVCLRFVLKKKRFLEKKNAELNTFEQHLSFHFRENFDSFHFGFTALA